MNKYYRSKITGKIIPSIYVLDCIYGNNAIEKMIEEGIIEEIEPPTMEELIKNDIKTMVVKRYRELHPDSSFKESIAAVDKLYEVYGKE